MNIRDTCIELSKRPEGVTAKEIGCPRSTASTNLRKLLAKGLVFQAGGHLESRYFDDPKRALAFRDAASTCRAPAKRSYVPGASRKPTTRAGWGKDAPMVITPATIFTQCPGVKTIRPWTNTYSPS